MSTALRLNGRDLAPESLLSGLALPPDGRLTPALAVEALNLRGVRARIERLPFARITTALLPAVLFLTGRDLVVAEAISGDRVRVHRADGSIGDMSRIALEKLYTGNALLLRPAPETASEDSVPGGAFRRGHWFWATARRFWPYYGQVVLASALINLLALAVPIFTMNVYDRVFPNAAVVTLWSLAIGVGVALVFDAVLKFLRASVVDTAGRRVDLIVSATLFRHMAALRLESRSVASGSLINSLKDFEQVRDFFSSQTVASLTDLAFAGLFIVVIYYIGGPLAYPPAAALAFVVVMGLIVLVPLRRAANDARAMTGVKNTVAIEAITDLETLKAVQGQGRMQARWEKMVAESATSQARTRSWANAATTLTALAQQGASIGIIIVGVYLALEGTITMGAVIAAMILSGRAMAPTVVLTSLFVRGSFAIAMLKSLNRVMSLPADLPNSGQRLNAGIAKGAISLRKVTLDYPEGNGHALDGVSLDLAAGDRLGVIGAVGAGKTSLVRLAAGLYRPTDGQVLLDELNMQQLDPAVLHGAVQLVPQDAVLFSGTLAENIAFGTRQATDTEVLAAARAAGVDKIAAAHPEGFAMPIAERGRNLSGGQRQMVALARALVAQPRVLILDEPTSAMDQQNEKRFIERLKSVVEARRMTLIVSTHRMGLLDLVDRLVVLDKGKVRADGKKAEVMAALARRSPESDPA